jgi:hypothetical protein
MLELDEIFYNALTADTTIAEACGYVAPKSQSDPGKPARIYSTCVEVPPTEKDNTPLPYIIIMDEGLQNDQTTKDDVWESSDDREQASVQISAKSPKEVKRLTRLCRKAIADYIATMEGDKPYLQSLTTDGTAWDWTKPCYYKTLTYQCDVTNTNDDEQD